MVSISGVIFILASLDGRLDLSDNSDLPLLSRDLSNGITWNGQSRTEGHFLSQNPFRRIAQAIFGASVFSVYLLSCYEDTDFGFAYEKKKCSVSIDTLQFISLEYLQYTSILLQTILNVLVLRNPNHLMIAN